MPDRKIILVDGHAAMYRAFFAIRSLSTASGQSTNAVFGFVRMIRQLRRELAPTHCMVVFDGGLSRERVEMLVSYKAQRPPMPPELASQFAMVDEYLDAAGLVHVRMDAVEADDIIASVALRAVDEAAEVLIASSDKDFFQLVSDRIRMVSPGALDRPVGPLEVAAKTMVKPSQIVDWLALTGDASDNIPGVPGIGAKTAASLLGRYGSLEGLGSGLGTVVPPRIRASLEAHWDDVARNALLVRLRTDIELKLDWDAMALREEEPSRLRPFYQKMEFSSMAAELAQGQLC